MKLIITITGYLVAAMTVIMYTPQSIKILKTKSAVGLSKITFIFLYLAYIVYVIWGPLNSSLEIALPAMISDGILIFIGWPILYYMFIDKKWIFYLLAVVGLLGLILSVIWLAFDLPTSETGATILSLLTGVVIGAIFTPQTWSIIKSKKLGNISIIGTCLIVLGNLIWIFFYIASMAQEEFSTSYIIQTVSCAFGILLQLPMIYLYLKGKSSVASSILKK